jgi:SAM-dependent methyltransferase
VSIQAITTEEASPPRTTSPVVWDRLWRHCPADAKDDALLAREERSPRWSAIVERLERTFGSVAGLKTVELGSGRGDLSALLARHGANVTLVDTSKKGLAQAARRFERLKLSASFKHADMLSALSSDSGGFDVALSSGVIEHFKGADRTRSVGAHFDILRPGGMALISVPNAWCPPYRLWKCYLELRGWWPYGVEIPYTPRELVRLAYNVGFSRVETCSFGFWQSIGDHLGRGLIGRRADWVDRPSRMDASMGMTLLAFAWRGKMRGRSFENSGCRVGRSFGRSARADSSYAGPSLRRRDADRTAASSIERHFLRRGRGLECAMETGWVRKHLPGGTGLIADIGCGMGTLFPSIGASRVVGVDHHAEGLTHTRARFSTARLICADGGRLPFADGAFDAITAQHVVEHIGGYEDACREWFRVMRPGGVLLLLTPNRHFCDPDVYADETHVRIFDRAGLRQVLRNAGFTIFDMRTLGLPWFRAYHGIPAAWRLRRFVVGWAGKLSSVPVWRWKGQTLCCAARRPVR